MNGSPDIVQALRQQLQGDRLLGLTFVPIPRSRGIAPSTTTRSPVREREGHRVERLEPRLDTGQKLDLLRAMDEGEVQSCCKCPLHQGRTRTVFGQGNPDARLVFVGEGPGYEEDRQGLAFVGRAGELLTKMIVAMGLTRDEVYICNVVKCRPPDNRTPSADEMLACGPYLRRQLETIQPEMIVALGAPATKTLLNTAESIGRLRGRFHEYYFSGTTGVGPSVPLMPTYHPAYLLRNPEDKRKTWDDLKQVMQRMGLPLPQ